MVRKLGLALAVLAIADGAGILAEEPAGGVPLKDMVVTPTRTETKLIDVAGSVQVLDLADIQAGNPITVDELFKTVVGVELQGSGFPGSMIRLNLRGMTTGYQSDRLLVLIDGRRVNEQYQGNVEFALLPADGIERIEVVRGPASALYGSNAMGGVINIVTRKGRDVPVTLVKAAGGSYNTQHYQASHGWKSGIVDYFVNASHVRTDGYMNNSDGTDRDWRASNVAGSMGVELGKDAELRMGAGSYKGEGTDENSERDARKDYQVATGTWRWSDERDARLLVRVYRNADHSRYDWKYPGEGIYRQETLAGELQQSIRVTEDQQVTVGGEVRRESVDIDEVGGPIDEHSDVTGIFVQDEIRLTETVRAIAGIRNDSNTDYGDEWSPRVGLLWRVSDRAELFGSVNRAHRAPSLSDRYVRVMYNGMEFVGNPELKAETLMAYEAGIRGRPVEGLSAELTVFVNDMEDAFDFMMSPDGVFRNQNATRTRSYGAEAGLEYRINDRLSVFANYACTEGTYEEFNQNPAVEGNRLAYLARDKAAAGVSFVCPLGIHHYLCARYVGPRQADAQNTPEREMGDYVVADWHGRLPVGKYVQLTLNVDNLSDETYQELPGTDQPGLTVMGGVEAAF